MKHERPFFSVIVPTYGRPQQLAACLESLARLDYPNERFEVIVVDDGSEMPPQSVVAPFEERLHVTLLTPPHAGPAAARNTGAARAKGELLVFTDDDCTAASDWLQTLATRFAATPDCAIGGRTLNTLPENLFSTASHLLIDFLYVYYNAAPSQARFFTSNNLALPADRFHAIGGFDPTLPLAAGEDREFCDRWLYHGHRMTYAPEVLVYHTHALTLRTFCRQQFNYGRGAFHFHQMRARRYQGRIKVERLGFYLNLLRYPLSQSGVRLAPLFVALLVVSQGAIATGFLLESRKSNHREALIRQNDHEYSYYNKKR